MWWGAKAHRTKRLGHAKQRIKVFWFSFSKKNRFAFSFPALNEPEIKAFSEAVAEHVEAGDGGEDGEDGGQQVGWGLVDGFAAVGDHLAPGDLVAADAEADEGEDGFYDDGDAHFQAEQGDEERDGGGDDFPGDGSEMGEADQSCGGDVVSPGDDEDFAA